MRDPFPIGHPLLQEGGLNLVAVFDLAALPAGMIELLGRQQPELMRFRQLLLFGHGGRRLWQALKASDFMHDPDPVDSYAIALLRRYFHAACPDNRYELLYPGGERPVPLQRLGELAGWHHPTPFGVGINSAWGSWFAYRAALLADTEFAPTAPLTNPSPCASCEETPCIAACPAAALADSDRWLQLCLDYRLGDASLCNHQCPARQACPVGAEQRYSEEQIRYHYGRSLRTIMDDRQRQA